MGHPATGGDRTNTDRGPPSVDSRRSGAMAPARKLTRTSLFDRSALVAFLEDGLGPKRKDAAAKHCRAILHAAVRDAEAGLDAVDLSESRVPGIPKFARDQIPERFALITTTIADCQTSKDGSTTKMVVELQDGHRVESVVMRHDKGRVTLCVSSQVGCKMGCTFCATGTLGELGNPTSGEILEQLVHANRLFNDDGTGAGLRRVSGTAHGVRNLVFMGMGEPLNNYDAVVGAIGPMTDPNASSLAPSRVTVSSRRRPQDAQAREGRPRGVPRAVAARPEPTFAREDRPHRDGVQAPGYTLRPTSTATGPKVRTMIEYCVPGGVNDTTECARELGELMRHRDVIVNLIPYNPTATPMGHSPPKMEDVRAMCAVLTGPEFNQFTTVRHEMGQDISGACGQLALKKDRASETETAARGCGTGDIEDIGGVVRGAGGRRRRRAEAPGGSGDRRAPGRRVEGGQRRRSTSSARSGLGRTSPLGPAGRGVRVVRRDGGVPGVPSLAHGGGGQEH